ncbi:nitrate ABC transporter substrate-binding protein [Nitrincola tapanii]|uniref:Nitrate ABC transporter substrate-binding protein n=2 Tax=Nitrincola tapanii TaxID=1708751 RepID=A0A5A9W5R5_9GAMM|nr:nitrate ABC transporter substrate-binding protein [Nitrincola tapanii]
MAATASASLPALVGCSSARSLRVGIHHWIGYETLYLAQEFNWFSQPIDLVSGDSAQKSMSGLASGELDAACLTLDEALRLRAEGVEIVLGLIFNVSAGADMVLARSPLADSWQGARLGYESSAVGALMLKHFLHAHQLQVEDLVLLDIPLYHQLEAWQAKEVDLMITFEPTASRLQQEEGVRIFDSRALPDTIFDVLAVRQDRIKAHTQPIKALLEGHFRALNYIRSNRHDSLYRIAARQGVEPSDIENALAGVILPSLQANQRYLSGQNERLQLACAHLSELMLETGILAQKPNLDQFLTPQWLPLQGF